MAHSTRDAAEDIWGPEPLTNMYGQRVLMSTPLKNRKNGSRRLVLCAGRSLMSPCRNCAEDVTSNGCGVDYGVKNNKIVGVRGRAMDRVNKGRLGPKGLYA